MDVASIEEAKVLLYAQPLASFIETRGTLVKQIRAAGDRDLANEVKVLRKPSAVAAAVNQVVRADPAGVELILQAAELLRAVQTGALDGSVVDAAQLQQQYRSAIQALAQSATTRKVEVRAALEAATIDEASNEDLRAGSLVVVPTPVSIFGASNVPVDELEQRRALRRAAEAAKSSSKASPAKAGPAKASPAKASPSGQTQAKETQAKEAAEKEKRDADQQRKAEAKAAEQQRKAEAKAAEQQRKAEAKQRQKRIKEVKKDHREALRAHLAALDAEESARAIVEQNDVMLAELLDERTSLEQALAELDDRHTHALAERDTGTHQQAGAHQRAREAEAKVEALAQTLEALETDTREAEV